MWNNTLRDSKKMDPYSKTIKPCLCETLRDSYSHWLSNGTIWLWSKLNNESLWALAARTIFYLPSWHHHHPHERCLLTRLQWCFHWLRYFPCPFWKPEPESLWPRLGPTASIHGARFHTKCQWAWNFASGAGKERSLNSYTYIPTFLEFHLMENLFLAEKKLLQQTLPINQAFTVMHSPS